MLHFISSLNTRKDTGNVATNYAQQSTLPATANTCDNPRRKIVVAMTGPSGEMLGIRVLLALRHIGVEIHLIISKWTAKTIQYETEYNDVCNLADDVYDINDMDAATASGFLRTDGMIIVPCSMKTLAAISTGLSEDLISRTADIMLKDHRRLVLVTRDTPLSGIHLKNMLTVTRSGAIVFPPIPAFDIKPSSMDDSINQVIGRMINLFDLNMVDFER